MGANNVVNLQNGTFEQEVLQATVPVLVDFWAEWCGPCKMIAPILDQLASEFDGKAKVVKINVDDHQSLAAKFNVSSIPTLLFFKDGKVRDQVIGGKPKNILANKLNELIEA